MQDFKYSSVMQSGLSLSNLPAITNLYSEFLKALALSTYSNTPLDFKSLEANKIILGFDIEFFGL